jgi:hypothetical protein
MGSMCSGTPAVFEKEVPTTLKGMCSPDFELKTKYLRLPGSFSGFMKMNGDEKSLLGTAFGHKQPKIIMHDARALQATFDSPAAFFKKHGFCLLQHKTAVKAWNDDEKNMKNEVTDIYWKEIEELAKTELYPNDNDKIHLME